MQGIAPMVITTDGKRAGATEQLAAFTRLLGVPLLVASHPVSLARALLQRADGAPVLIDTAGADPREPTQAEELRGLAATVGADPVLVLPAGLDPAEAGELALAHAECGAAALIVTRLDLAHRMGGVIAAAAASQLPLVEAGIGDGAADGLVPSPLLCWQRGLAVPKENTMSADAARFVAIASGKGGVGKTWLAITLSHALIRAGRRVLLFDADLGLANVDVQLGLTPAVDLGAVISGQSNVAGAITRHEASGLAVLPGRSGSGALSELPPDALDLLLTRLRAELAGYDAVVLDLGAGVDRVVRRFAAWSDRLLVVATDEADQPDRRLCTGEAGQTQDQPGGDVRIVVNQALSMAAGQQTYTTLRRACLAFLHREPPLAGVIRHDPKVRDAIRRQSPLLLRHPNCAAAQDVEALARSCLTPRDGLD